MSLRAAREHRGDAKRIAESHPEANLQLIACAGAGKTETVSLRIVEQLKLPDVGAANIVAFTFTERAAAELKDRIAQRYEDEFGTREGIADLFVGTIHGFCLEMLQQFSFDLLSYGVLNDVQQRLFISRSSRKSGLADLGWHRYHDPGKYGELMSVLREADVDDSRLAGSDAEACLQKYLNLLADKRYLDFTAILYEAVTLLETGIGDFRERVLERTRHVTVDEYQDVNPIQERLLRALAALGSKVCVVGDDDQLLYSWRGSRVANIQTFADRYDDVEVERLERNHRSSAGVVDLARDLAERISTGRLPKSMFSAGNQDYEDGDIVVREFEDPEDEADFIAVRIDELLGSPFRERPDAEARGLSLSDMAVLVRKRSLIERIAGALERRGRQYIVGGVSGLFRAREAEASRQLFYYLAGQQDQNVVRRAWRSADIGISDNELKAGLDSAEADRASIALGEGRFGIYNLQRSFLSFLEAIELREEKIEGASPAAGHTRAEVVFYNLGKFSQIISDFEQINFQSAPKDKYDSFAGFLRYQAENIYPEGWLEARYVIPDAVQIMTIHQAKGLQWPVVFVPGLTKCIFPPRGPGGRSIWNVIPDGAIRNKADYMDSDDDERRVLYVGCTRAKKYLHVTRAEYPAGKVTYRHPSFLWDEVSEAFDRLDAPDPAPKQKKLAPRPDRQVADVALSFSELKYGFECPYSFKLRFLYGFNPPIAEALGYGKSLHDMLFELHDRAIHGGDTSQAAVDELVDRHMFVPFAFTDLRRTLTDQAEKRLREYIEVRGATFDDIEHAERPVELDLGGGVRVAGRIDLIRRRSTGEVVIIDFKSTRIAQQEVVTDLQLRVYALGYRQATGEDADAVVVENLDDLKHPRVEPVTPSTLGEASEAIRAFGERIRGNELPRHPRGEDRKTRRGTCERCDMRGICGTAGD